MVTEQRRPFLPLSADAAAEADYSNPAGADFDVLSRDRMPVRSMVEDDLEVLARIDRKITGQDRTEYLRAKLAEALYDSGVRVSLVAELEGNSVGFIMARMDFGEFGHTEPVAVIDTIGVHPDFTGRGVGEALISQLLANLAGLHVEQVETTVAQTDFDLLGFFYRCGFEPSQRLAFSKNLAPEGRSAADEAGDD